MPSDLAVCYVGDIDFALGSLISMRSLRRFAGKNDAEVFIFCLDMDLELLARLALTAAALDATVLPLDLADRVSIDSKIWNKTHVPPSALGRFFLEPQLPSHIQRILYLDGDTLFVGDPQQLLSYHPPEGRLAAAEDISFFARRDWGKYGAKTRAYFNGLGIDADKGYLNSGVLFAGREAWRSVAADAMRYFNADSRKCLYHDQSAINAVIGDRRVRLSPRWNFQTPFCYWGAREKLDPRILHFTEFPKPWMGDIEPWISVAETMREGRLAFANLGLPERQLPAGELTKLNELKLGRARRLARRMPMRLWWRRQEIYRLARQAAA
jgi:lipopolysaccharide biosynthesis glycosyltransferase